MSGLRIEEHAKKQANDCSGGTKRKLSYAMAMLGDPRIVLLDEPSCGMDPQSKRFVWDTILASFKVFLKIISLHGGVYYKCSIFNNLNRETEVLF